MLLALLVAFCGSLIFIYLHLPLPWLLGSIFATSILIRFQKIPIQSPKLFSAPARILIGLAIGSAFTPAILNYIPQYTISLLLVVPFTITSPINNLNYGIILYGKNRCKKIITQRVV